LNSAHFSYFKSRIEFVFVQNFQQKERFMNLKSFFMISVLVVLFVSHAGAQDAEKDTLIAQATVAEAERLLGLEFNATELDSMLKGLQTNRSSYESIRRLDISNAIPPALLFNPVPLDFTFKTEKKPMKTSDPGEVTVPDDLEKLAFYSVGELAELIRTRRITSVALTRMYLDRLERFGPQLKCMVTLTEALALEQAQRADSEIVAGRYRGPLHGYPLRG